MALLGDGNYLVSCLNLIANDVTQLPGYTDHFCEYCIYGYAAVKQGDVIQQSALFIKMTEHECRYKSTSCSLSGVIQTLISMCLISILALHRRRVIAWLHIQCPRLKLPKVLALKC